MLSSKKQNKLKE